MVVVEDILLSKDAEMIAALPGFLAEKESRADGQECIKVFWDSSSVAADLKPIRTKPAIKKSVAKKVDVSVLREFLASQKFNFQFDPLMGEQLLGWVAEEFHQRGLSVSRAAAEQLIWRVGNDSWLLKNEIGKLAAYVTEAGAKQVELSHVQLLAPSVQFDDNIFNLVDAVGQGQKSQALKLMHDQIENGANEMYLMTMINRAFRILTIV
ncbi:hypothetical protein HY224_03550, partial [Candidatus Uhrbacteria bacterium]|nr:hypothetical protein [Candidatus Uhrbacteria bacterium]